MIEYHALLLGLLLGAQGLPDGEHYTTTPPRLSNRSRQSLLRVEIVFGEEREVLRTGTDGVFDHLDNLRVAHRFGLLYLPLADFVRELLLESLHSLDCVTRGAASLELNNLRRKLLELRMAGG